jgi:competence protein ComEC
MNKRLKLQVALAVVMVSAGCFPWFLNHVFGGSEYSDFEIAFYNDISEKLNFDGTVVNDPDIKGEAIYMVLEAEKLILDSREIGLQGKVLLKVDRYPQYYYGDRLRVSGFLKKPFDQFPGSQDSNFVYSDYLAKDGIYSVMYSPMVWKTEGAGDGWSVLFWFKNSIKEKISELFKEPAAGVIGGILIGTRSSVPSEVMDAFNRAGLTHILAISGYNITLLINIMALLAKSFSRRGRFIFTIAVIAFFSALTGFSASVIRAALMGGLSVFALQSGRKSQALTVILLSGTIMVLINPKIMLSDISFQLSFLSTLGLILLMPFFEKFMDILKSRTGISPPSFIGDGLMVTLAAQIFTTPITLYYFGRFSLISPLTNVLFLPLIPLIMLASFLALVSSFMFMPWTAVMVALCWLLMEVLLKGVGFFAAFPFASLDIQNFSLPVMAVYYLVLAFIVCRSK